MPRYQHQSYRKGLQMTGQPCPRPDADPGRAAVSGGLLGEGTGTAARSPESMGGWAVQGGVCTQAVSLEEDDVLLAGFLLVRWCGQRCGGRVPRREGQASLGGEALGEALSRDRAQGWEARVWKRGVWGVSSCQAPRAAVPLELGSPGVGRGLWLLSRTGLSERRFREAFSSLPMSLLSSGCCFRSKGPERKVQPGCLVPGARSTAPTGRLPPRFCPGTNPSRCEAPDAGRRDLWPQRPLE